MKRFCILLLVILLAKFEARAQVYDADMVVSREGVVFDTTMRNILLKIDKKEYAHISAKFRQERDAQHIQERTASYILVSDSIITTSYSNWTADEIFNRSPNCGMLVIRNGYICEKITDNNVQPTFTYKDSAGYKVTYKVRCYTNTNCNHSYRRDKFDEKGRLSSRYDMDQFPFPTLLRCVYAKDSVKTDSLFFYSKYGEAYIYYVERSVVKKYDTHSKDSIVTQLFETDYNKKVVPGRIGNTVINNTYNSAGLLISSNYTEAGIKYSMNITYEKASK